MKKLIFLFLLPLVFAFTSNGQGYNKGMMSGGPALGISFLRIIETTFSVKGEYGMGFLFDNVALNAEVGIGWRTKRSDPPAPWYGISWYEYSYKTLYMVPTISYHFFADQK